MSSSADSQSVFVVLTASAVRWFALQGRDMAANVQGRALSTVNTPAVIWHGWLKAYVLLASFLASLDGFSFGCDQGVLSNINTFLRLSNYDLREVFRSDLNGDGHESRNFPFVLSDAEGPSVLSKSGPRDHY